MGNLSWQINANTGDYVLQNGSPVIDTTLKTPAYIRLKSPRTRWLYAPDNNYGSDYYLSHVRIASSSQVDDIAKRAMQPFLDTNRAQSVDVETVAAARGAIEQNITITDSVGQNYTLNLTPVGGV
jgi:phage gp46-like protein